MDRDDDDDDDDGDDDDDDDEGGGGVCGSGNDEAPATTPGAVVEETPGAVVADPPASIFPVAPVPSIHRTAPVNEVSLSTAPNPVLHMGLKLPMPSWNRHCLASILARFCDRLSPCR